MSSKAIGGAMRKITMGAATVRRLLKANEQVGERTEQHVAAYERTMQQVKRYADRMDEIRSIDAELVHCPITV
jgi:hypothetical protein